MATATRLDVNMGHWAPVTRLYETDVEETPFLAVTCPGTGAEVFAATESGTALSMEPANEVIDVTTHGEALEALGFNVVDAIGETIDEAPKPFRFRAMRGR